MKRFDSDTAPLVESSLKELIGRGQQKVVYDFSSVEYINSTGLRVLLTVAKTISKSGGALGLCSLRPPVLKVFEIAGFTRIFRIFATCDEAIRNLA
jgi:anti-sigma B factor antagonist